MRELDVLLATNPSRKKIREMIRRDKQKIIHFLVSDDFTEKSFVLNFRPKPKLIPFRLWSYLINKIIDIQGDV